MSSPTGPDATFSAPPTIYHQIVRPPTNGIAVAALILGIVAIVFGVWMIIPIIGLFFAFISFVPAVLALVFGVVGLRRAREIAVGRGAALTGVITGAVTLGIGVLTTVFWIIAITASAATNSGH